jgi:hypothetical protein
MMVEESEKEKFMAKYGADPSPYMHYENNHPYSVVRAAFKNPNLTREHIKTAIDSYGRGMSPSMVKFALETAHAHGWRHGRGGLEDYTKANHPKIWADIR